MAAKGLMLINYNPTANTRDRELSKARALSHAARQAHDRKRDVGKVADARAIPRSNLNSKGQVKGQDWEIQVTALKSKQRATKNFESANIKLSSPVLSEHGPEVRITIRGTTASSSKALRQEDDGQVSSGPSKWPRGGYRDVDPTSAKRKGHRQRKIPPVDFDVWSDDTVMSQALILQKTSTTLPTDRRGFRADPFSAYPIRICDSVSEALDYCMSSRLSLDLRLLRWQTSIFMPPSMSSDRISTRQRKPPRLSTAISSTQSKTRYFLKAWCHYLARISLSRIGTMADLMVAHCTTTATRSRTYVKPFPVTSQPATGSCLLLLL
jgi:hypothetical protein